MNFNSLIPLLLLLWLMGGMGNNRCCNCGCNNDSIFSGSGCTCGS